MDEINLLKFVEENDSNFLMLSRVPSVIVPELKTRYHTLDISSNYTEPSYSDMQMRQYTYDSCPSDDCQPSHVAKLLRSLNMSNNQAVELVNEVRSMIFQKNSTNIPDLADIYNRVACNHVRDMVESNIVLDKFTVYIGGQFAGHEKECK